METPGPKERILLSLAEGLAHLWHEGQTDKGGQPYIGHIERVAARLRAMPVAYQIVAWLHDLVEDTMVPAAHILMFPEEIVRAVIAITRQPVESYEQYIERVAKDRLAREVKLADLADNLDDTRPGYSESLAARYIKAREHLERANRHMKHALHR